MKFDNIPRYPTAVDKIECGIGYLVETIENYEIDFDPPYQRGYIWSEAQKVAYVEHILKGGDAGNFVLNDRMTKEIGGRSYELVDGKQRLTAILDALAGRIRVFGVLFWEIDGRFQFNSYVRLTFLVYGFTDQRDVVGLYLSLNQGGSVHTDADLQVAREYLESLL